MTNTTLVVDAPTSKDEAWKYTPIKEISSRISTSNSADRTNSLSSKAFDIDSLASDFGGPKLVFVNGFFNKELSVIENLPTGLFCGIASDNNSAPQELLDISENVRTIEGLYDKSDDYDVALIKVNENIKFDLPIHIVHVSLDETDASNTDGVKIISHPRTIIELAKNAKLTVVETFCGVSKNSVTDASTTIRLGDNAQLEQCRIQNEQHDAVHVGTTKIEQGLNTKMYLASITIGADIARNAIEVQLASPDSTLDLTGINLTNRHQVHDTVATVTHDASNCFSNQRFVGVVDDHGHGSFGGEIIVQKGTVATDAHQTNRNLILNINAKADTRPWLRIFADDVKCTHGATVGRLDEDSLFYLRSRGIELNQAKTMLIDAFLTEIMDTIENDVVRESVKSLVSKTTNH